MNITLLKSIFLALLAISSFAFAGQGVTGNIATSQTVKAGQSASFTWRNPEAETIDIQIVEISTFAESGSPVQFRAWIATDLGNMLLFTSSLGDSRVNFDENFIRLKPGQEIHGSSLFYGSGEINYDVLLYYTVE